MALTRIKQDPLGAITPAAVEEICRELGYTWRERELAPAAPVALFVQQILRGNTPRSEVPRLVGAMFTASAGCPAWMNPADYDALPASITVREIRRTVRLDDGRRITVTIVTTRRDAEKHPADELIQLRLRRWDVETHIRPLKTTMGLEVLRCKSENGVRKELAVFALVYNRVRVVMLRAAKRQSVGVDRIRFVDTLKWMRHARPGDQLPDMIVNPSRPHRIEPRCGKRGPKSHKLMTKPRDVLREELKNKAKSV